MTDYTSGPLTTEGITGDLGDNAMGAGTAPGADAPPPESKLKRGLRTAGWIVFGLFCLIVFTLLKLPGDRIQAYVQGMISAQLAPRGIGFTAEKGYISIGWGVSYVMKDITLTPPPPYPPAKLDKVAVTPSILPMILGYQGGSFALIQGDSKLTGSFSMKGPSVSASFDAKGLDLGKTGALALLGVKAGGIVTGKASFSGDLSVPSTLNGDVNLSLSKVVLDPQTLVFVNIPRVAISEGKIEVTADRGKATIKSVRLGKPGSADDLQGTLSGDIMLGRNWDSSTLNAKANFKLSEPLMKSLILLDAFLGPGKQGDGSYSLTLTGPLTAPNAVPMARGAK
jgi:type II secretion system protein N